MKECGLTCLQVHPIYNLPYIFILLYIALIGVLFPTRKIPAFTVIRMFQGVGYTVAVIVPLFAVITVSLWMEISLIVIALISYSVLLFTTHNRKQIFPLCFSADSSTSV